MLIAHDRSLRVGAFGALLAAGMFLSYGASQLEAGGAPAPIAIESQSKPDRPWRTYQARTLEHLPGFSALADPMPRSRFGGRLDRRLEATGFFRLEKVDGRWWFVDPEGHPYLSVGLTSTRPPRNRSATGYDERFGDEAQWAEHATALMRELGFNGIGRWSRIESLRAVDEPMPYTTSHSFMASFGGKLGITHANYGNTGFRERAIPVFHPEFEAYCDEYARRVGETAEDPYLLGHFSDNELPMARDLLTRTLENIAPDDPVLGWNHREAWRWFRAKRGKGVTVEQITDEDNLDYLGHVMDRYYAVTTRALRKYAPNHLCLGSRLHGAGLKIPQVLAAAGRHLDVVSINYYNVWEPREEHVRMWAEQSPAPVLITEFYVKGADSGMDNDPGAGWIVPTQRERGLWYQNFTLRLLENPHCVGWHYFKYQDTPGDSNKGVLDAMFQPYEAMVSLMAPLNHRVYSLVDYFDARRLAGGQAGVPGPAGE